MPEVKNISLRSGGDARFEGFQRSHQFDTPVPSKNLAEIIARQAPGGKLSKLRELANKIEAGNGTESDEEVTTLYESLDYLVTTIEDLVGMCRRREEALAECNVRVGAV